MLYQPGARSIDSSLMRLAKQRSAREAIVRIHSDLGMSKAAGRFPELCSDRACFRVIALSGADGGVEM